MYKYLFLFFIFNRLFAEIIEINKIDKINEYIDQDTLVIFDLDNTVYEKAQSYGSDQWYDYTFKTNLEKMKSSDKAFDVTYKEWVQIDAITEVKPVEKNTKKIIDDLQNKNLKVMALTTRGFISALAAINQLNSIEINFSISSPFSEEIFFESGGNYKNGILFANGKNKAEVLKGFFEKIKFKPKKIVFIDDKHKNVLSLEPFCDKENIKYFGLRYGFMDKKVRNFDPDLALIQKKNFNKKILTDEEAKKIR